jgi:hypothetical protein
MRIAWNGFKCLLYSIFLIWSCLEGFFDEFVSMQSYTAEWAQLSVRTSEEVPGMRGGHQMVIDSTSDTIYLLGGWDGCTDLADFWKYNIETGRWTCISEDTAAEGGPGPRRYVLLLGKFCMETLEFISRTQNFWNRFQP